MDSAAEERRQRILANRESRLEKLRRINDSEKPNELPTIAPVSTVAPDELWKKPVEPVQSSTSPSTHVETTNPTTIFEGLSTISSTFSSISSYFNKGKPIVENTNEMIVVDQQHGCVALLGFIMAILYTFYISSDSNLFFHVFFLSCVAFFTSRYIYMKMKHRSNMLISTFMLSGFKPDLVKKFIVVYTLIYDGWIIFSIYFVTFSLSNVFFRFFT